MCLVRTAGLVRGCVARNKPASFSLVQARRTKFTLNPVTILSEKLTSYKRREDDPEELHRAIRKSASSDEGNLFDAVGDRVSNPILQKTERSMRRERGKISVPECSSSPLQESRPAKVFDHHKYSTPTFKISHRKLNLLANQIAGKPIDYAILQMTFSEKRASKRVRTALETAKDHAERYKGLQREKLIVAQSWVNKRQTLKRIDIKGRGRRGIRRHFYSNLHVVLKEGRTYEERVKREMARKVNRVRSAGLVREDRPLRNVAPIWAW